MKTTSSNDSERGVTLVVVALALTGLLAVAGLAIDGGRLFTARRNAQDGVDAAALAGTYALFGYQCNLASSTSCPAPPVSVITAVTNKMTQNGLTLNHCYLINANGTPGATCDTSSALAGASGVQVIGGISEGTSFMRVVGINTYTASAVAAAAIQPLIGITAPFVLCGAPAPNGYGLLNSDGTGLNTSLEGTTYVIQGSQIPTCGMPSDKFKGLAGPGDISLNSWISITNGNPTFVAATAVAGLTPCTDPNNIPASGCGMVIPIADQGRAPANNPQAHIVAFALFNVKTGTNGTDKYVGTFLKPVDLVDLGAGAFGDQCQAGTQACVVNLVQ